MSRKRVIRALNALTICAFSLPLNLSQQQISGEERGRATDMLQTISSEVKKYYYDPKFHGWIWTEEWKSQEAD